MNCLLNHIEKKSDFECEYYRSVMKVPVLKSHAMRIIFLLVLFLSQSINFCLLWKSDVWQPKLVLTVWLVRVLENSIDWIIARV